MTDVRPVIETWKKMYTGGGATDLDDPFLTLVATLVSARTRDEQVLKTIPAFRKKFPDVASLAAADVSEIESVLSGVGMYKTKAKRLKALAGIIDDQFGGKVPETLEELTQLPGVGRKTANIILTVAFNKPAIGVDTHVHRVSNRLGWVNTKTPEKTETALEPVVPKDLIKDVNRVMVKFGRYICIPGNPRCWACPVQDLCPFEDKNTERPRDAESVLQTLEEREQYLQELRKEAVT